MQRPKWLALGYNVPINPSKNRVYVWRKLKEYGAGYFKQGVALLPKNNQSLAQFRRLSAKILEMGGEASIVELKFLDEQDELAMIARFRDQSAHEYLELIRDCANLTESIQQNLFPSRSEHEERMKKMIQRAGKVKSRDYFDSHEELADSIADLAEDMGHAAEELGKQLKKLLD